MNVNCIICSDIFIPTAEIYTTSCGHLFHFACLVQWMERSKSCPQCRAKATEKTIHRVYFNVLSSEGITDDASTLQFKLDNMQYQLRLKDTDIKNLQEKHEKAKYQATELRKEVKSLEHDLRVRESAMHAYKEQILYFKNKSKDCDKLTDEMMRLKDRLVNMETVQAVINGSQDEANEMLRNNRDPHALTIMVTSLKKELLESERRKKHLSHSIKQLRSELSYNQTLISELQSENKELREIHKNCDIEKQYLKQKVKALKASSTESSDQTNLDTSIRRIITESPAPYRRPQFDNSHSDLNFFNFESPPVLEKVKQTLDSDSPYLPVKTNSLASLVNKKSLSFSTQIGSKNKYSIFKTPSSGIENFKVPRKDLSYDGLGGYAKDEKFPSPKKALPLGAKRPKSSSTLPSSKFRKLAPNKKMSDFLTQKNET